MLHHNIPSYVYCRGMRTGWVESSMQTLSKNLDKFKSKACTGFANYRQLKMGILKLLLLKLRRKNLLSVGSLEYLPARLYEAIRKCFKKLS